jgi:hypothetical protein
MHFPRRIIQGSGEVTSDPLYVTLLARRLPSFPAFPLGDTHEIARLAADVAEADEPKARYPIGEDAQHFRRLDR